MSTIDPKPCHRWDQFLESDDDRTYDHDDRRRDDDHDQVDSS